MEKRSALSMCKGGTRDLTHLFKSFKNDTPSRQNRFKPMNANIFGTIKTNNDSDGSQNGSQRLLPTTAPSSSSPSPQPHGPIPYSKQTLPPKWVDAQEQLDEHMEELEKNLTRLRALQSERIKAMASFDDNRVKALDAELSSHMEGMTRRIRECEEGVRQMKFYDNASKSDAQIR